MKVLVLGATGMLGHRLLFGLDELGYEVLAGVRRDLSKHLPYSRLPVLNEQRRVVSGIDGFDTKEMKKRLLEVKPDVVLNCIGVIKQRVEGDASIPCIALNALLPHVLEEIVSTWNGWLIHFSTDCVFTGKSGQYSENDASDATDLYGRTKAMGEVVGPHALTLRTSIIGPELSSHLSLVDWFRSQDGRVVRGYARAIYSGVTTREMVRVIDLLLREHHSLRGLYHLASNPISKYDLLCMIKDAVGLSMVIKRDEVSGVIDRSLRAERISMDAGYIPPSWPEMIAGLADDLVTYPELYTLHAQ
ncbi:dTDP-4-dehydrorhamnose reductase family protein [Thiocapsa marina]|uniref:dTDP-4-dehydrorhamnose reductase n=1 Tax=Thiocapsa marina 5811 TaxID=768671 RepID=F9U6A9_9GAMM|nr:SDR family oxidoreductase [Thiocapsa marina]EGV20682.1 NAD-dependent epimerase/dehydratase [Thiocapsa marina 5811]